MALGTVASSAMTFGYQSLPKTLLIGYTHRKKQNVHIQDDFSRRRRGGKFLASGLSRGCFEVVSLPLEHLPGPDGRFAGNGALYAMHEADGG